MFFDTHTHLNDDKFKDDQDEVINRARKEFQVDYMLNVGFNKETIEKTMALAHKYNFIYAAVGWHPHDANDFNNDYLQWLKELSKDQKVVALGEMGLDYYWDNATKEKQKEVFRAQIQLAKEVNLPIIIHDRDAHEDVYDILKEEGAHKVGGVIHCFGGDVEFMEKCLDINFHIGLGGPVTFKNAAMPKEVAKAVPLDRLFIETDCPYLAPHPYRGKRNETGYVSLVAEKIAELKGIDVVELANATKMNALRLFKIR